MSAKHDLRFAVEQLEPRQLLAAVLPDDLNKIGQGVAVEGYVESDGILYFFGSGSSLTLWRSDGTEAGTQVIFTGRPLDASERALAVVEGRLFFVGSDFANGPELWTSDGTAAGTHLVTDLNSTGGSFPRSFTALGDKLLFTANTPGFGREIWTSDGTAAGTIMLIDLAQGPTSSDAGHFVTIGSTTFFAAQTSSVGRELFKTDGTADGTALVKNIASGSASSNPQVLTALGNMLMFQAFNPFGPSNLWRSDGTSAGTVPVGDAITQPEIYAWNNHVYFAGATATAVGDSELWRSDGTDAGTERVADIFPGLSTSNPNSFTAFGDAIYFRADNGVNGVELWKSDGTTAGTALLKDINPGGPTTNSTPGSFSEVNGKLLFTAAEPVNQRQLWETDGTAAGTQILALIAPPGGGSGFIRSIFRGDGILWACVRLSDGYEYIWKSNATAAGTVLVDKIEAFTQASDPRSIVKFGDSVLFSATDGVHGRELWISDGTPSGTRMLKELDPSANNGIGVDTPIVVAGSRAYFVGTNGNLATLWYTDGTTAGTQSLGDLIPNYNGDLPSRLYVLKDDLILFKMDNGFTGSELWKTDGTLAGTSLVKDIVPGTFGSQFELPTRFGDEVFFSNFGELWKTDGTSAGTTLVKQFNLTQQAFLNELVSYNGKLYIEVDDRVHGGEMYISDGTGAGTTLLKDIRPGPMGALDATNMVGSGGFLYFAANDGNVSRRLWKTDGTEAGTVPFSTANPGFFVLSNDTLYFTAGQRLWKTDGTTAGTVQIFDDMFVGSIPSIQSYATVGDELYLTASGISGGIELWKTDGTAAGTQLVSDINEGNNSSEPMQLTEVNGTLFFAAQDLTVGRELWVVPADNVSPTIVDASLDINQSPHLIRVTFSEDVEASLSLIDLQFKRQDTGQSIRPVAVSYDTRTFTAEFRFSAVLPDARFLIQLPANAVSDFARNPSSPFSATAFFMNGDVNRDARVDISDFAALAANFNTAGGFVDGDFNYDGTVGISDFSILASKFNQSLPEVPARRSMRFSKVTIPAVGEDRIAASVL